VSRFAVLWVVLLGGVVDCKKASVVIDLMIPGLKPIVECLAGKNFVEVCESGMLLSVLENLYGELGASLIVETLENRLRELEILGEECSPDENECLEE